MQYNCGVPERILMRHPSLKDDSLLVVTEPADVSLDLTKESLEEGLKEKFGPVGTNPGDFVFVFDDAEDDDEETVK